MVRLKDIAEKCNVSITTVSNILNNKGKVGEKTKQKVLKTAKELNYVPNFMAKNLKQRNSKLIGIITEDLTVFNCPEIVDGINEYLDEKDYSFILGNMRLFQKYGNIFYTFEEYHSVIEKEFQIMFSKNVSGIIYVGAHCRNIHSIPKDFKVPITVIYSFADDDKIPSIIFDDEQAAYMATRELISNGHKKIGLISGDEKSYHAQKRLKGYQKALYESGILFNPDNVVSGDWKRKGGYKAAKEILKKDITSIFIMNDVMAIGAYDYFFEKNIIAGKDISIIGFDNNCMATSLHPSLTTVELPLYEMGVKAAKITISSIENKEKMKKNQTKKIECKLIRRKSISNIE